MWASLLAGGTRCRSCSRQQVPRYCLTVCRRREFAMVEACDRVTLCHPCSSYWLWKPSMASFVMLMPGGFFNIYRHDLYHTSLYVDDVVFFRSPADTDLQITKCILSMFEKASGLGCNLGKCQIVPIRCHDNQVQVVHDLFPFPITTFPIKY
jgi:hypothetical protein